MYGENIIKLKKKTKTKVNFKQYPIVWNYQTIFTVNLPRIDNDL